MIETVPRRADRYLVFDEFARGGMATVHFGRLVGERGFSRLVAIKMLAHGRASQYYVRALEDEARIASRIRHPNVVQPLDVVVDGDDLLVVLEYVHGVSFGALLGAAMKWDQRLPAAVTVAIMSDVLKGLHAAHEALDELGRPLGVVHRDVSPQNALVGVDGISRLADFGIAKVMRREEQTTTGVVKGKISYMSPEQLRGFPLTRQADVFAAGAVLAEALSGVRPSSDSPAEIWLEDAYARIDDEELRAVLKMATEADPKNRYASAAEMAGALSTACSPASADVVGERVTALAGDELEMRAELVRRIEAEPVPPFQFAVAAPFVQRSEPPVRAMLIAGGAVLAMLMLTFGGRLGASSAPPVERTPAARPSETPPEIARPSETPPEIARPSETAPGTVLGLAPDVPSSATPLRHRPRTPPRPRPATTSDCVPTFRIAPDGSKHYKPECFE